jgi:hypothetical protein
MIRCVYVCCMLTAVQLFCLRVSGSMNVNASFLVAIMFPSICISSLCVLYYLHIKALEGYRFIYLFIYVFIYLFFFLVLLVTELVFVSITRKLGKEHQRAWEKDLEREWYCKFTYIRMCLTIIVLKTYNCCLYASLFLFMHIALCTPVYSAWKLEGQFLVGNILVIIVAWSIIWLF